MPRAITALLVHIGPLGAALEAAFPFAAIALGAVLLMEHLENLKAAGQKLTEDQMGFQAAVQNAFNTLDQRLIQSQIKTDELRNDHLGALRLQLELLDKQSLAELVKSFGEVAKAADVVFTDLKSGWYQFCIGSAGAKNALTQFQSQYDGLMASGKDKDASNLLKGTLDSAKEVLAMQKQARDNTGSLTHAPDAGMDIIKSWTALEALKKSGVGYSEKEVKAQQTLVDALSAQVSIEAKVAAIKNNDKDNASTSTGKDLAALRAEGERQAAAHAQKMAELSLDIDRENSAAQMAVREASIAERLAADVSLADRGNSDSAAS
jgi:hypothetical protein